MAFVAFDVALAVVAFDLALAVVAFEADFADARFVLAEAVTPVFGVLERRAVLLGDRPDLTGTGVAARPATMSRTRMVASP